MGNWHSALLPLDCFAKVGRQSLPAWALVHGEPMYSSWDLVATPAVPLAVVLEGRSLSSGSGQNTSAQLVPDLRQEKLCPTPSRTPLAWVSTVKHVLLPQLVHQFAADELENFFEFFKIFSCLLHGI